MAASWLREGRTSSARMTFTMLRQVIVEMSRSFRVTPSRYDGGDRLDPERYQALLAAFDEAGIAWDDEVGARETLAALRATYEPLVDGLSRVLLLAVPDWLPADDAADHWQRGHRGLIAARLVEQLSTGRAEAVTGVQAEHARLSARLRKRLRRS